MVVTVIHDANEELNDYGFMSVGDDWIKIGIGRFCSYNEKFRRRFLERLILA